MNEDKTGKPLTDEQPFIAQPTADKTTDDSAAVNDQPEQTGTPPAEFLQADVSAETAAEEVIHPEAASETETPYEASSAAEVPSEASSEAEASLEPPVATEKPAAEPLVNAPQHEQTAVTESEAEKPVLTKSPFEKPEVDEAKIEQLVTDLLKDKKINQLNQKTLANLLKKLSDSMNESGELSVPFTIGARDSLVGPAANRMLSKGFRRKQPKKTFLEAGINLVGVQQQIAAHAHQTEGQPSPTITSRRVKNAQKAEAFCGFYPWC
jgi:hypothetical protein